VCLHHDAGALGAVWNEDAWVRRLLKLKEMGCNAIRTSHNPPATELLDLCDRMGFLVLDELTDTWTWPGREGKVTPVHVYTSGDEAELFLNGKSLGRKQKDGYRIVWDNVLYAPGTLEVVCYKNGRAVS
jgi:beta-galactosidase/beta-glucuronidase